MAENVRIREEMELDSVANEFGESAVAGRQLSVAKEQLQGGNRLPAAAESAIDFYWITRLAVHNSCTQMSSSLGQFTGLLIKNVRKAKEENPIQFLGAVFSAAFAAGISARLWSCRRHG